MSEALYGDEFDVVMRKCEASKRWDLMLRFARERLASQPDCTDAHRWMGLGALRSGDLTTAVMHADELQVIEPDESHTFQLRAELCVKQGQLDNARACLEEALARWPDNANFHQMLAGVHILRNDETAAIAAADRTLCQNPDNLPARFAAIMLKHHYSYRIPLVEQQIAELQSLLAVEPNHAAVLAQIGEVCLYKLGSPAKAIPFLEQSLASDPHHERRQQLYELARRLAEAPAVTNVASSTYDWPGRSDVTHIDAAAPPWPEESRLTIVATVDSNSMNDAQATCVGANSHFWTNEPVEELLIS